MKKTFYSISSIVLLLGAAGLFGMHNNKQADTKHRQFVEQVYAYYKQSEEALNKKDYAKALEINLQLDRLLAERQSLIKPMATMRITIQTNIAHIYKIQNKNREAAYWYEKIFEDSSQQNYDCLCKLISCYKGIINEKKDTSDTIDKAFLVKCLKYCTLALKEAKCDQTAQANIESVRVSAALMLSCVYPPQVPHTQEDAEDAKQLVLCFNAMLREYAHLVELALYRIQALLALAQYYYNQAAQYGNGPGQKILAHLDQAYTYVKLTSTAIGQLERISQPTVVCGGAEYTQDCAHKKELAEKLTVDILYKKILVLAQEHNYCDAHVLVDQVADSAQLSHNADFWLQAARIKLYYACIMLKEATSEATKIPALDTAKILECLHFASSHGDAEVKDKEQGALGKLFVTSPLPEEIEQGIKILVQKEGAKADIARAYCKLADTILDRVPQPDQETVALIERYCALAIQYDGYTSQDHVRFIKAQIYAKQGTKQSFTQALELLGQLRAPSQEWGVSSLLASAHYKLGCLLFNNKEYDGAKQHLMRAWDKGITEAGTYLIELMKDTHSLDEITYVLKVINALFAQALEVENRQKLCVYEEYFLNRQAQFYARATQPDYIKQAIAYFSDRLRDAQDTENIRLCTEHLIHAYTNQASLWAHSNNSEDLKQALEAYEKALLLGGSCKENIYHVLKAYSICQKELIEKANFKQIMHDLERVLATYTKYLTSEEVLELTHMLAELKYNQASTLLKENILSKKSSKNREHVREQIKQLIAQVIQYNIREYTHKAHSLLEQLDPIASPKLIPETAPATTMDIDTAESKDTSFDLEVVSQQLQEITLHDSPMHPYFKLGMQLAQYQLQHYALKSKKGEDSVESCSAYKEAIAHLYGTQRRVQNVPYGFALLSKAAALGSINAAFEIAHIYWNPQRIIPCTYITPESYGLPSLHEMFRNKQFNQGEYQARLSQWRSGQEKQSMHIQRSLVYTLYNPTVVAPELFIKIINSQEDRAYLLKGAAYAYFDYIAHTNNNSLERYQKEALHFSQVLREQEDSSDDEMAIESEL